MGRSKSAPLHNLNSENELLGRCSDTRALDWRLATELAALGNDEASPKSFPTSSSSTTETTVPESTTRKRKRKASRKKVQFASEAIVIPNLELEIDVLDDESLVVLYTPQGDTVPAIPEGSILLYQATFPAPAQVLIRNHDEPTTKRAAAAAESLPLTSALSILDLGQQMHWFSHHFDAYEPFRDCLQAQNVVAVLLRAPVLTLQMYLTPSALQVLHPSTIPLRSHQTSKAYRCAHKLQTVLATLFPNSILSDVVSRTANSASTASHTITAQHVYRLLDNRQLQQSLQQPLESLQEKIPGLIPVLRGYQQHAVRWMVQREHCDSVGNEWELAWWGLCRDDDTNQSSHQWKPLAECNDLTLLLYCPFTGWLVTSRHQARDVTLGHGETQPIRGGILAESMGLGKTVEVLACILANPMPVQSQLQHVSAKRRLAFDDSSSVETTPGNSTAVVPESTSATVATNVSTVGFVGDMTEFGDADDDDDDEEDHGYVSKATAKRFGTVEDHVSTPHPPNESTVATPVTPDKDAFVPTQERFIDEEVIGSCICGELVRFSTPKRLRPIIICESCQEPMHRECSCFVSDAKLKLEGKPVLYRRTFSDDALQCYECDWRCCPCCTQANGNSIRTGATLIITPAAILNQWEREIQRHARTPEGEPLRVLVYEGIDKSCKMVASRKAQAMKNLHPRYLASAEIVLMTFDALMSDLGHSDENRFVATSQDDEGAANLRRRKRYRVVPSPLMSILWWRVCLDEAQRVETPTAASAKMAWKLQAQHRWCVSGTPVGKGKLEDLYGLLLFLRVEPFASRSWFTRCLNSAHRHVDGRIQCLLQDVFWRSTKSLDLVREQMGVPEQVETKVMLRFSSIEKHFYERQLEQTVTAASDATKQSEKQKVGKKRKDRQLNVLADQLHKLRAACCHPQVGSSGLVGNKRAKAASNKRESNGDTMSVGTRVMTMAQILDRFVDDARLKCEESQRLAVMHTNAMGAIAKLKVECKDRGIIIKENNLSLLSQSCKLYLESLELAEANGKPTLVLGEAVLSGSTGFSSPLATVRDGVCSLSWKISSLHAVWSTVEFEGPARRVTEVRIKAMKSVPPEVMSQTSSNFQWHLLQPKDCIFQVSSAAVGGEFVDVVSFSVPPCPGDLDIADDHDDSLVVRGGFRTNKAKSWRIVVKAFHGDQNDYADIDSQTAGVFVGLELELYEAEIASDALQRLHCLHNASLSFQSLLEEESKIADAQGVRLPDLFMPKGMIQNRLAAMNGEAAKIESMYMELARSVHRECGRRLDELLLQRHLKEKELFDESGLNRKIDEVDCFEDGWWDDFLVAAHLFGSETQKLTMYHRLVQELEGHIKTRVDGEEERLDRTKIPEFGDIVGFRTVLQRRIRDIRTGIGKESARKSRTAVRATAEYDESNTFNQIRATRFRCSVGMHRRVMKDISELATHPTDAEIFENSHCKVCKADWFQTGPKCSHCSLGEQLEDLTPDKTTLAALNALHAIARSSLGAGILKSTNDGGTMLARAKLFFETLEAEKKEKAAAWCMWRVHLELLNDLDELNQCKSSMRLAYEGEDLTELTDDQLNAVVMPVEIVAKFHEHAAKQAMALGDLRRAQDTLRYLKNLSNGDDQCAVCLTTFDAVDRGVLRCGHSFHVFCIEELKKRSGGHTIYCPMRCRTRTEGEKVLIASSKRKDDGSRSKRAVKGSWGTKVSRLVSDVLDIGDTGDKGIIFSQWEDMLDIVQEALVANGVGLVRATSLRRIGECTRQFRSDGCTVLLLNVKNGAEGLTLLEATHVFMVEPLLNCGLDSQAISRIDRIGQNRKTHVWRYLMEDTIEVKIDALRMEHQEDEVDDAIYEGRKLAIQAGGIDGGLHSAEELFDLLS